MKGKHVFSSVLLVTLILMAFLPVNLNAQEEEEKSSPFSAGADLVSSYLWRGTKFGTGPAIQPYVEVGFGGFAIGGWGSYCFTSNEAAEADLYASYSFNFGLSIGLTDYYYPGGYKSMLTMDSTIETEYEGANYFDGTQHGFEINLGYEIKGFSISANYMINEGAGADGGDMYFEIGYSTGHFGVFAGAGNGWHTVEADADESDFNLCNIGVSASTELQITEKFSLPLTGMVVLNPDTKQFHVVAAVSF
jgi:hypothetical protein